MGEAAPPAVPAMSPDVEEALKAVERLEGSVEQLMRLLWWRDFETLADLVRLG